MDCKLCTYELAILTTDKGEKNVYFEKNAEGGHKKSVVELMGKFDREYWCAGSIF